jgi:hypothetical protein
MGGMHDAAPVPMLPLRWHRTTTEGPAPSPGYGPGGTDPSEAEPAGAETAGTEVAGTGPATGADSPGRPEVVIRTSNRRRKTATAFWEGGRIVVVMPTHVRRADRAELVEWLVARVLAKRPRASASDEALTRRAASLADRYVDGQQPASIRWVTNQGKRWGSCTNVTREIRISHRLRAVPEWVLDATIVHELAHLVHPDHSPGFHQIADRYPRQREAGIYLEGYSLGLGSPDA